MEYWLCHMPKKIDNFLGQIQNGCIFSEIENKIMLDDISAAELCGHY